MSVLGTVILVRTVTRGHDFGERLEPTSAAALRDLWRDIERKCFKLYTRDPRNSLLFDIYDSLTTRMRQCKLDLTSDPEQQKMRECHQGIESMYMQCREAATLGDVEDHDPSAWSIREVVFPPTRVSLESDRD
jgi:hypothetical protein